MPCSTGSTLRKQQAQNTNYCIRWINATSRQVLQARFLLILCSCIAGFLFITFWNVRGTQKPSRPIDWIEDYKKCSKDALLSISPSTLWDKFAMAMRRCEARHFPGNFPIEVLHNGYEKKHARLPVHALRDDERCVVVVLGIGRNIKAEIDLRKIYPKKCQFYGADPDANPNKALFESINGSYFQGAISSAADVHHAVLQIREGVYKPFEIRHVALETFLKDHVGLSDMVDWASIDIEGGEIELFPALLRNGTFDQLGMDVCQINMELHLTDEENKPLPDDVDKIYNFLLDSALDERYIFLKPRYPFPQRITYYALNVQSVRCRRRYIDEFF